MSTAQLKKAIRAAAPKRKGKWGGVFLTDIDGTVTDRDTTVVLNEKFGSTHQPTGMLLYQYVRQQHAAGLLSIAEHLGAEYVDVLSRTSLAEVLPFLLRNIRPREGVHEFITWLRQRRIRTVGVSNGAHQIAGALIQHHAIPIRGLIANSLEFTAGSVKFKTLSGSIGLDKGAVVKHFHEKLQIPVVGVAGDSPGDRTLFKEAGKRGVPVFVAGRNSVMVDWCREYRRKLRGGWRTFEDFTEIKEHLALAA